MIYPPDISRRRSWTKEEIRKARKEPLKPILEQLGYHLQAQGQENHLVLNMPGRIIIKASYWIDQENKRAGNAIDFFVKLCSKSFHETMKLIMETKTDT